MDLKHYQEKLAKFAKERNWEQFHSPKNLSMALSGEAGELVELFQWLTEEQSKIEYLDDDTVSRVKDELADILIYLLRLADKLNINLEDAIKNKLNMNAEKYPIDVSYDSAVKYDRRKKSPSTHFYNIDKLSRQDYIRATTYETIKIKGLPWRSLCHVVIT